jgi:hypothetical protein
MDFYFPIRHTPHQPSGKRHFQDGNTFFPVIMVLTVTSRQSGGMQPEISLMSRVMSMVFNSLFSARGFFQVVNLRDPPGFA